MTLDEVTLVTEDDRVIGAMDKIAAHRIPAQLHRAVSVFLLRRAEREIEVLLQQRSSEKIVGALQWANTVCGNVLPGESYEACALRRLEKELSITDVVVKDVYTLRYHAKCNEMYEENEIDHIFVGWYDKPLKMNPHEVAAVQWESWTALTQQKQTTGHPLAPWFKIMLEDTSLMERIHTFTQREI